MATTTNYGWTTPDNTDLVKDGASAIRTLGSSIDTTLKAQIDAQIPDAVLTTTGDVIYASGASTPARLGIGSTGQVLSVASGLPSWTTPSVSKNLLDNAGMDIWQRGTSFTVASSTQTYTADRWMAYRTATGATISQQTTSPNYSPFYTRVQRTASNTSTNIIYLTQALETSNSRPLAGKTVTLSWWARAGANYSSASSLMTWEFAYGTGTNQNMITGFTGQTNVTAGTKTLTTSWQQFTTTGTISTTANQIGVNFYFTPVGTAGAADYFDIADVQLEVGSIATSFSRQGASIEAELANCQRYYYRMTAGHAYSPFGMGTCLDANQGQIILNPPVILRTVPTSVEYSSIGVVDSSYTGGGTVVLAVSESSNFPVRLSFSSATSLTANRPAVLRANNNINAYVGLSAEL
jgi:hypothetical protein